MNGHRLESLDIEMLGALPEGLTPEERLAALGVRTFCREVN